MVYELWIHNPGVRDEVADDALHCVTVLATKQNNFPKQSRRTGILAGILDRHISEHIKKRTYSVAPTISLNSLMTLS